LPWRFSLLVARLITPMMAAYFMRAKDAVGHDEGQIVRTAPSCAPMVCGW
jgi:multidrug efflux pump subunit AcrB